MRIGMKALGVALICCLVQARAAHATVVVPWQTTLTERLPALAQAQPPAFPYRLQAQSPAPQQATVWSITDEGVLNGYFDPDTLTISAGDSVIFYDDSFGPDGNGSYLISSDSDYWQPFLTPAELTFPDPGTYGFSDDYGDYGTIFVNAIPEPSTLLLASFSALGLGMFLKRRHAALR
jgi:hypothetical protein